MLTQMIERQELQREIDTLPDSSVIAMLDFVRNLRLSTETFETDDGFLPHIPNAKTAEAIRDGRAGRREKVTIGQIMAELNAGN